MCSVNIEERNEYVICMSWSSMAEVSVVIVVLCYVEKDYLFSDQKL